MQPTATSHLPPKLGAGDEIRVLALSRSLGGITQPGGFTERDVQLAAGRLESLGLKVSFGHWVAECNEHLTASTPHRLEDFHEAISSPSVKAILAVTGGVGAVQLLDGIDYKLIATNPKAVCGFSDIAYLCNAIYARSGVTTYYGPNFTSFMMQQGADYTVANFRECLFGSDAFELHPVERWSDDAWHKDQVNRTFQSNDGLWAIQQGEAEGIIIGGNCWCLNMLQGTKYFPPLRNAVLFLEQPAEGKATLMALDSGLRALTFQPGFSGVRGIVLGRYARNGGVTRENLTHLLKEIPALNRLPVIANCDFGHTAPVVTLPIGGHCKLKAGAEGTSIMISGR
jgi:muramoyltetrapeptide carboxypeptidase LdcA involved in peptidoglycan recycling